MGLDYAVGSNFSKRIGTYSEALYFDKWLQIACISSFPVDEGKDLSPSQSQWHLDNWLPEVKTKLKETTCVWDDAQPPTEFQPDKNGTRQIANKDYPLSVTVSGLEGKIAPGGFRSGCPPSEFLRRIEYIIGVIEDCLNEAVLTNNPIVWC